VGREVLEPSSLESSHGRWTVLSYQPKVKGQASLPTPGPQKRTCMEAPDVTIAMDTPIASLMGQHNDIDRCQRSSRCLTRNSSD
jgi:hypothetical protein